MSPLPKVPAYLLYGSRTEDMMRARDEALNLWVPEAFRDEGLTEYYPTNALTVDMGPLLGEIAMDFATRSFIAEAPKCVVVTNPREVFGRGGGSDVQQAWVHWIEQTLPETGNALILLAMEDESRGREIDDRKPAPIVQAIQNVGYVRGYRDGKAFFKVEDAILGRDAARCIAAVRELYGPAGKGEGAVFGSIVRCLRYLLQANIARDRGALNDPRLQAVYFPAGRDGKMNLMQARDNVKRKYVGAPLYRTAELLRAYERMLDVHRAMRPHPGDHYVPDSRIMLERTLLELINSPRPKK